MYQLSFKGEPDRYEICYQAVVLNPSNLAVSQWDDCIGLLKKLKSIGVPSGQKLGKTEIYDLASDRDGVIQLERGEYKLLRELIAQPMWRADTLEDVQATRKWLDSLKEEDAES